MARLAINSSTSQITESRKYKVLRSMAFNERSAVNMSLEIGQWSWGISGTSGNVRRLEDTGPTKKGRRQRVAGVRQSRPLHARPFERRIFLSESSRSR
jgi:hypothetical protein